MNNYQQLLSALSFFSSKVIYNAVITCYCFFVCIGDYGVQINRKMGKPDYIFMYTKEKKPEQQSMPKRFDLIIYEYLNILQKIPFQVLFSLHLFYKFFIPLKKNQKVNIVSQFLWFIL